MITTAGRVFLAYTVKGWVTRHKDNYAGLMTTSQAKEVSWRPAGMC
ncbi:hypothetical protein LJR255_004847 [Pararhizobium sp. LjRoot255]